jgi:hypothetical protein
MAHPTQTREPGNAIRRCWGAERSAARIYRPHGFFFVMEPFGCKRLSTADESSCSRMESLVLGGLAFSQSAASGMTTLLSAIASRVE